MYRIEKMKKKHDCFSIFSCGCNQSQIFPRSGGKFNNLHQIKEDFLELITNSKQFRINIYAIKGYNIIARTCIPDIKNHLKSTRVQ
jgi:hypothetical protein